MLDKLRSMAVFVRVVEAGSFRLAAERLELSASVVSHHITQLESELGVRLLYRSTRHVALTDQGAQFYEDCRTMVEAAEGALSGLRGDEMRGRLWVVAPTPLSVGPFVSDVAEFCRRYPEVEFRIEFDDSPRNLIQEGIDVAIRFGEQKSSSLVARPLLSGKPQHYVSPAYIAAHGTIETLDQLRRAHWITLGNVEQDIQVTGPDGQVEVIEMRRRVSVNSVVALHELTLAGIGVAQLPPMMVQAHITAGQLVEVLPDWQCEDNLCYAVFPSRAMPNALSRRFVDFIYANMFAMKVAQGLP